MATIGPGWKNGAFIQSAWADFAWTASPVAASGTHSDDQLPGAVRETVIRDGHYVLTITLTNAEWKNALFLDAEPPSNNFPIRDLMAGMASDQSEAAGWNAIVRDTAAATVWDGQIWSDPYEIGITNNALKWPGVGNCYRVSDTVMKVAFPAFNGTTSATNNGTPAYDIKVPENITITIPANCLVGGEAVVIENAFTVKPVHAVGKGPSRSYSTKKRKKRYVVEVEGQYFDVASPAEAQSVLQKIRDLAPESAKRDTTDVVRKPPRISLKTASGAETTSLALQKAVYNTQEAIIRAYRERAAELEAIQVAERENQLLILERLKAEDEADAILALLLT